eukprot:TRINITY_DN4053_c0_g1_i1.p1 TRINITY_DN4053_c0_g1~~TRINITY_DN4053_c0_g1_i1.p1  ORF type:complete len:1808 (-),score=396.61 TRINITY_DN4053_c0_g1_i1:28-5451(-)
MAKRPGKFEELLNQIKDSKYKSNVIDCSNMGLGPKQAAELVKVITYAHRKRIEPIIDTLNLAHNRIAAGSNGVIDQFMNAVTPDFEAFANEIEKNRSLTHLNLSENDWHPDNWKVFMKRLRNNLCIVKLGCEQTSKDLSQIGFFDADDKEATITDKEREEAIKICNSNLIYKKFKDSGGKGALNLSGRDQPWINLRIYERHAEATALLFSDNALKSISPAICRLTKLTKIDFSNNQLVKLPTTIGELVNLVVLNLENNKIKFETLPLSITNLLHLQELNLKRNLFNRIPRFALGSMNSLVKLLLADNPLNPLIDPRLPVLVKKDDDGTAVLKHLRRVVEGSEDRYSINITLLGNRKTGKTALLHNLSKSKREGAAREKTREDKKAQKVNNHEEGDLSEYDEVEDDLEEEINFDSGLCKIIIKSEDKAVREPHIRKLNIRRQSMQMPAGLSSSALREMANAGDGCPDITFTMMDFGGDRFRDEIYPIFLSRRAVNLILFDLRRIEESGWQGLYSQCEYWLQLVQARTNDGPVILVGTFLDHVKIKQFIVQESKKKGDAEQVREWDEKYLEEKKLITNSDGDKISKIVRDQLMKKFGKRFGKNIKDIQCISNFANMKSKDEAKNEERRRTKEETEREEKEERGRQIKTRIKVLKNKIMENTVIQDFIPERLPQKYLALEEKLMGITQARPNLPMLDWQEYKMIASGCGIDSSSLLLATQFLRSLGKLVYDASSVEKTTSRESTKEGKPAPSRELRNSTNSKKRDEGNTDGVVLSVEWLIKVILELLSQSEEDASTHNGLISLDDIQRNLTESFNKQARFAPRTRATSSFVVNAPTSIPETCLSSILKIMVDYGVAVRVNYKDKPHILVPSALSKLQEAVHPSWPPYSDWEVFSGREFLFEFLPIGFFSKLLSRFLEAHTQYITGGDQWWKGGVILTSVNDKKTKIKLEMKQLKPTDTITYDNDDKGLKAHSGGMMLELWVRGGVSGSELSKLVDNIETMARDWLRTEPEVLVPCIHCYKLDVPSPTRFGIVKIKKAATNRQDYVKCCKIYDVKLASLAPDISMSEFKGELVNKSDIFIEKQIGIGGFAKVYKGVWNDKVVAVKELTFDDESTAESLGFDFEDAVDPLKIYDDFRQEASLMTLLHHPNLVQLVGVCLDPFCMLLEFMALGSLYDYIHDMNNQLTPVLILMLGLHIAEGMNFMHTFLPGQPLIHRDLKSPNVLVNIALNPISGSPEVIAKVADFGLSRNMFLSPELRTKAVDNPVWLAPEVIRKDSYDEKVDVYAFGVMLWELVSRQDFLGEISFLSAIEDAVLNNTRPPIPDWVINNRSLNQPLQKLIKECWDMDPAVRPSFEDAIAQILAMLGLTNHKGPINTSTVSHLKNPDLGVLPDFSNLLTKIPEVKKTSQPKRERGKTMYLNAPENLDKEKEKEKEEKEPEKKNPFSKVKWLPATASKSIRCFKQKGMMYSHTEDLSSEPSDIKFIRQVSNKVWVVFYDGNVIIYESSMRSKSFRAFDAKPAAICVIETNDVVEVWTYSKGASLKVYDANGKELSKVKKKNFEITCMAYSANQDEVWCGGEYPSTKSRPVSSRGKSDSSIIFDSAAPLSEGGLIVYNRAKRSLNNKKEVNTLTVPDGLASDPSQNRITKVTAVVSHINFIWAASGKVIYCIDPNTTLSRGHMGQGGHTDLIKGLLNNGKELWSWGKDKTIKIWNPEIKASTVFATLIGHLGRVNDVVSNGRCAWSVGWEDAVLVWDVRATQFLKLLKIEGGENGFKRTNGKKHKLRSVCLVGSKGLDEDFQIWAARDKQIVVWR